MRVITLEEHFLTESFVRATGAPRFAELQPKLLNLAAGRIADMDEAGVDLQVLSLASMGIDALDAATATSVVRDVNDELASAVRAHPTRFAGFASLALKDPQAATAELDRCVTRLGFPGALVDGTTCGVFLDDPRFLPVFEAAAHLNVPIYLHPAPPPEPVRQAYFSGLPGDLGFLLSIAGWGWHAETGLHTLRLIVAGLFDRFPTLQLIIGHMGEGLPYALARSSGVLSAAARTFGSLSPPTSRATFISPPAAISLIRLSAVQWRSWGSIAFSSQWITPSVPTCADELSWTLLAHC